MYRRDYRDIAAGMLAVSLGIFAFVYAQSHYDLGTLRHPGAGMFPAALGLFMAVMGCFVVAPALLRAGPKLDANIRPALTVAASIAVFALIVTRFGLVPAIVATVLVSSFAETPRSHWVVALLAVVLTLVGVLVFVVGLKLSIPLFSWRF